MSTVNVIGSTPVVDGQHILATAPTGSSAPDSITVGGGSIWVEYGNGSDSTGASGSTTIVQYSMTGLAENTYTVTGLADGLKYDPATGMCGCCSTTMATPRCNSSIRRLSRSAGR